jgi:hypothetical protein
MSNRTAELEAKAARLVKAQRTSALLDSLGALELGAPEPSSPAMPTWCKTVGWIEDELIARLGCEEAHTEWVLSDAFGDVDARTSWAFLAEVAK